MNTLRVLTVVLCSLFSISIGETINKPVVVAVGIDFGTSFSVIGGYVDGKGVEIVPNDKGNRITPSVVSFTDTGILVGEDAQNNAIHNPENTIFDIMRFIGRDWNDKEFQRDLKIVPYKIQYLGETKVYPPEEIMAMILLKLHNFAEAHFGQKIQDAIISCPTYFADSQRDPIRYAGRLAGFRILQIVTEHTAAAMAFGLYDDTGDKNILVFDVGEGIFGVSLLNIERGFSEVLSQSWNMHFGKKDFEQRITTYCLKRFTEKIGNDVSIDTSSLQRLNTEAGRAHISLSRQLEYTIEIENFIGSETFSCPLTRMTIDDFNFDLFVLMLSYVQRVIEDANITREKVDHILVIGSGANTIPTIYKLLRNFFNGKEPLQGEFQPAEAVAYGATIEAKGLVDEFSKKVEI